MNLNTSEALLIYRHRKKLTQAKMGNKLFPPVGWRTVAALERGALPFRNPPTEIIALQTSAALTPGERCLLKRRRLGLTQAEVAKRARLSRQWVIRQEQGKAPCVTLLKFWNEA